MVTTQLSIFLENKEGRLSELYEVLAAEKINFAAWSLAETEEFGILRTIVSEPERACRILKEANFGATLTEVVRVTVPNTPGSLCAILRDLADGGVSIEYLYNCPTHNENSEIILKPDDIAKCETILNR